MINNMPVRLLIIICLFVIVLLGYFPGIHGALYYDDYSNLQPLSEIKSIADAINFTMGGVSGLLGRPISLATFVPFYEGWPNNTSSILLFNIVLHGLNFIIIGALGTSVIRNLICDDTKVFYISWMAAFLWAVMPLLVSSSLISIQRMTGLSAFFMLLGLCIYVNLYKLVKGSPAKGMIFQLVTIFIFTSLALFSKENGVLLPAYALLIDILIRKEGYVDKYAVTTRLMLLFPTIFVIFYISPFNIDWFEYYDYRGYTPAERLATQSVIILEYLKIGFLPQSPTMFSPFHDYYAVRGWDRGAILASALVVVLLISSVALYRKSKWFLFSSFWFFNSHLIESTTIMLELYFEHRNYLAFYGFLLAISYYVFTNKSKGKKIIIAGLCTYAVLMWSVLFSVTSLWGDKEKAASVWHNKHPGSARAVLHSVFIDLGEDNVETTEFNNEFIELQKKVRAILVLDKTSEICNNCIDTRLLALIYSCPIYDSDINYNRYLDIRDKAKIGVVNLTFTTHIFDLFDIIDKGLCNGVNIDHLYHILNELLKNDQAIAAGDNVKFLFVKAMIYESKKMYDEAFSALNDAEELSAQAIPILQYQVYLYNKLDLSDQALDAIKRRESLIDANDLSIKKEIQKLRENIMVNQ